MAYNGSWKSFAEQLELLKSRGLVVTDEAAALSYLERIGYYRLSAYWYPFRHFEYRQEPDGNILTIRQDNFVPDTQFLDAVNLYKFDKQLRLLVLDVLERIEVALRVDIAYLLGERNTYAHHDIQQFHPGFAGKQSKSGKSRFDEWHEKYAGLVNRSKEDFVKHYREKHGPDLPIWVAIEVWDFGVMSQLFAMMKVADQEKIARKYGMDDWRVFQSWLRSLNYLRNLAAHHSRLWNRNVIDQPKLPARGQIDWCDAFIGKADLQAKPFLLLAICRHLVKIICPGTQWTDRFKGHLQNFPVQHSNLKRSVQDMGAPEGWETWW
jgi:abortive infection bacteriophage resistance protein